MDRENPTMADMINVQLVTMHEAVNSTYDDRKIAKEINEYGYKVSTCWVNDFNCYETAIIKQDKAYPVGRCDTLDEAEAMHNKWMKEAKDGLEIQAYTVFDEKESIILGEDRTG